MTEDEYLEVQALARYRAALEILRDVSTEGDRALRVEVTKRLHQLVEGCRKAMGDLEPGPDPLGPIRQTANLDGCGWRCPCGAYMETSDGFSWEADRRRLGVWLREHGEHSNGQIECRTSADGLRVCTDPGVQVYPISKVLGEGS